MVVLITRWARSMSRRQQLDRPLISKFFQPRCLLSTYSAQAQVLLIRLHHSRRGSCA